MGQQGEITQREGATVSQRPKTGRHVFGGSEKQKSRGESKDHQGKQGWWIQTVLLYHRKLNGVGVILKEEYVTVTLNTPTEA